LIGITRSFDKRYRSYVSRACVGRSPARLVTVGVGKGAQVSRPELVCSSKIFAGLETVDVRAIPIFLHLHPI
jgi:hypothetical protein